MCTDPTDKAFTPHVADMMDQFTERPPVPGYASYRARLGLTIATLASVVHPATAAQILGEAATEAIEAADGYAARDVLGFKESVVGVDERQRQELRRLAADSGLGVRALPEPMMAALLGLARDATDALESSLLRPNHPSADATAYEQGAP